MRESSYSCYPYSPVLSPNNLASVSSFKLYFLEIILIKSTNKIEVHLNKCRRKIKRKIVVEIVMNVRTYESKFYTRANTIVVWS